MSEKEPITLKGWLVALTIWAAVALVAVLVIILALWGMRWVNRAGTSIEVREVDPRHDCAIAVTHEGVAISCWEKTDGR